MSHRSTPTEIPADPSHEVGETVVEMNFQLNLPNETEPLDSRIKFYSQLSTDKKTLNNFRIQITSDINVFFVYQASFSRENFEELKVKQQLNVDFNNFPNVLKEMFSSKEYSVLFTFEDESKASLKFQQKLKFKVVDILSIYFSAAPIELIQQIVQYRFTQLKCENASIKSQLDNVFAMLKIKDPSVLRKMSSSIRK